MSYTRPRSFMIKEQKNTRPRSFKGKKRRPHKPRDLLSNCSGATTHKRILGDIMGITYSDLTQIIHDYETAYDNITDILLANELLDTCDDDLVVLDQLFTRLLEIITQYKREHTKNVQ